MPKNLIKAYSVKLKRSEKELEQKWEEAKNISIKNGKKETDSKFHAYVVTVFQRLLGVNDEEGKPLGLHDVNSNKAFQVEDSAVPSFKEFVSESNILEGATNDAYKKDSELCNNFLTKLKKFITDEGFSLDDDFEKGFVISYPTSANPKHNAATKRFIKCAVDINYGW